MMYSTISMAEKSSEVVSEQPIEQVVDLVPKEPVPVYEAVTTVAATKKRRKLTFWSLLFWSSYDVFCLLGSAVTTISAALISIEIPRSVGVAIEAFRSGEMALMPLGMHPGLWFAGLFVGHAVLKFMSLSLLSSQTERLCARVKTMLFEKIMEMVFHVAQYEMSVLVSVSREVQHRLTYGVHF